MTEQELLNYTEDDGIIATCIQPEPMASERREYIQAHEGRIWQGNNGYWYTYIATENGKRKLVKRNTKQKLENAIVEHYKVKKDNHYFKDVFHEWLDDKLKYGEIQMQTYTRYLEDYQRYIKDADIETMPTGNIDEIYLETFIKNTICEKNLKRKAFGNLKTLLRGTFKYAKKRGYTQISITQFLGDLELSKKIFNNSKPTDEESVFTQREVDKIVDYINSHDDRITELGILLAFQTGLRVGELIALRYSDICDGYINVDKTEIHYKDFDGKTVREIRSNAKTEAGNRKVFISNDAIKTIKRIRKLNPFEEYMFKVNGTMVLGSSMTRRLRNICKQIGIMPRSMHKIRKTYATRLINSNVDEKLIMRQLGHTDIATTKKYYYFNDKSDEEARTQIVNALAK